MRRKTLFIIAAMVSLVALIGLFVASMALANQPGARPTIGSPAPDFDVTFYPAYRAGLPESIKLSELHGKVVLVNFWASWCVECRKESDALEKVWRQNRDRGLVVLGIDYLDTESAATKYLQEYDTTYAIGIDTQEHISHPYRITGVPESFFIDKQGAVRKIVLQAMTEQELTATIENLLKQ